ncbi:hypothetical protein [Haliangium sp.]|uniref:hypothetical protein n=1 Tax=Haliangium sp. TaxID=2663208 RepID=UPI003D11A3D0
MTCRHARGCVVAVGLVVGLAASTAHAQPAPGDATGGPAQTTAVPARPEADRPWARGVSPAARARAQTLHREGYRRLLEGSPDEALAVFHEALVHWDHPGIHFKLALVEKHLGRLLEARASIERALRYGDYVPPPLSAAERRQAIAMRDEIHRQIAAVWIRSDEPAVAVTIDGHALSSLGTTPVWLLPGAHRLIASKSDYVSVTRSLVLHPGQRIQVDLHLAPRRRGPRRWAAWKPWAMLAAGVAAEAGGAALHWRARRELRAYHGALSDVRDGWPCPMSCPPRRRTYELTALVDRANGYRRAAIVADVAGAVVIAGGIALIYANRPWPRSSVSVRVAPSGGSLAASIGVAGTF